ncbi:MAG: hypothetical protein JSU94_01675 [Phycisphaerales bacterium]|nr:MAG: hypothetical protein JSU94_01675 [Phycisphaerales bacterium]
MIMYVYIEAGLSSHGGPATGKVETGPAGRRLFWLGMAATVVITALITRLATNALRENVPIAK